MACCCPSPPDGTGFLHAQREARSENSRPGIVDECDMVLVDAGSCNIGSDGPEAHVSDGEFPLRRVQHDAFLMDKSAVTNRAFADFVASTGYMTEAERFGWSFVFYAQVHPEAVKEARPAGFGASPWWRMVPGACWLRPDGPGSDCSKRGEHPVVHVSWNDASTYARWAGKRLPSETEWEVAARGGLEDCLFPWGDELTPNGEHLCNIWQGSFPDENTAEDGYLSTAPALAFMPNGYGLFNMVGNTWEWTADRWSPANDLLKAMRGGSYLCHHSYCNRYRVSARTGNAPDAASSHLGFRCAATPSARK